MQPNSSLRRSGIAILVGGGSVASAILGAAMYGSVFVKGNIVGISATNPNTSFVQDTKAVTTPFFALSTATGGLTTRDTILVSSPYNATASTRGLRTGTGVVRYLQLDIIANPANVSLDCTVVAGVKTATGGTVLINNASGTGTIVTYVTPFTLGPTQYIKCATLGTPTAGFRAVLRGIMGDSDVVN